MTGIDKRNSTGTGRNKKLLGSHRDVQTAQHDKSNTQKHTHIIQKQQ